MKLDASELGAIKEIIARVEATDSARENIRNAMASGSLNEMRQALAEGIFVELESSEVAPITEAVAVAEARQVGQDVARANIARALTSQSLDDMRTALDEGLAAELGDELLVIRRAIKQAELSEAREDHEMAKTWFQEAHKSELKAIKIASDKEEELVKKRSSQSFFSIYVTGDAEIEEASKQAEQAKEHAAKKTVERRQSAQELATLSNRLKELQQANS